MLRLVWKRGSGKERGEGEGKEGRGKEGGVKGRGRNLTIKRNNVCLSLSHFDVLAVGFLEQLLIV